MAIYRVNYEPEPSSFRESKAVALPQEIESILEGVPGFFRAGPEIIHSLLAENPAGPALAALLGALFAGLILSLVRRRFPARGGFSGPGMKEFLIRPGKN